MMWKLASELSLVYKGLALGVLAVVAFAVGMTIRDGRPDLLAVDAHELQTATPADALGASDLPVIDLRQPAEYETATFALG